MYGCDLGMGPCLPRVTLAHAGCMVGIIPVRYALSRKSQQPLAWVWPLSRIGIGQWSLGCEILNLNCKASTNAGCWLCGRGPLGIIGNARNATATARRGMRPGAGCVAHPLYPCRTAGLKRSRGSRERVERQADIQITSTSIQ